MELDLKKKTTTTLLLLTISLFFFSLVTVSFLSFNGIWFDLAKYSGNFSMKHQNLEYWLDCGAWNGSNTCPRDGYPISYKPLHPNNSICPEYFRWIHEDLKPWKDTGITRKMLEKAKWNAYFRLIILDGKIYVETILKSEFQTRHLFTMYGIVHLLRWYPVKLPNLEIMFKIDDLPVIRSKYYRGPDSGPPPLFSYCADWKSLDIVDPDWSFWGWAETNIKPWRSVIKDIKEGNKRTKWKDRVSFAYWKGNPYVSPIRKDLLKCNVTDQQSFFSFFWTDNNDFDTLLYIQDWIGQSKNGYKESNLDDQCTHRLSILLDMFLSCLEFIGNT